MVPIILKDEDVELHDLHSKPDRGARKRQVLHSLKIMMLDKRNSWQVFAKMKLLKKALETKN